MNCNHKITFEKFNESHFSLMLKWLEKPHIKKWWDSNVLYTPEQVKEKYTDYTNGHRKIGNTYKSIQAYVIRVNSYPIGYIQTYNAYDFPRDYQLSDLPENLASLDFFIGDEDYLFRGIGSKSLNLFLNQYIFSSYRYAFVDPKIENEIGIRTYEKAGFSIIKKVKGSFWMIAYKPIARLSAIDSASLEVTFKNSFLKNDRLWIFGSRADLSRKGGDLDLYIETHAASINEAVARKEKFLMLLKQKIGDQKTDIVLNALNFPYKLPIYDVAKKEGVRVL